MKRLVVVVIALVFCAAGVGFYRGWFALSSGGSGGTHRITFTVDEDKIKADEKAARDQLPGLGHTTTSKAPTPEPGKD